VSTCTYDLNIDDFGGNPAQCEGGASHNFSLTGGCNYSYYYSTTVHHNGQFVDDDYHSGSGAGPASFTKLSSASGTANAVFTGHYTTGSHGSYIENDDNPDDWDQSSKSSSVYRASD